VPYEPVADLAQRFDAVHARIRGQAFDAPRQARGLRLVVQQPAPTRKPVAAAAGVEGPGPRVVHAPDTTLWIPENWRARRVAGGLLLEAA
jgi:hypothetical protein